jgi:DNA-binding LytR/AlgR family response regulator
MIRIAVCDDEAKTLDEISLYINQYVQNKNIPNFEVFRFNSATLLCSALEDGELFDIFLLDVYIGKELGTELANNIRRRGIESPIVFITTSLEHAPQSFEIDTLRYLIKPLDPAKFYEAMDVALLKAERLGEKLIKFKTENGIESINANSVMYSESHSHYQYVTLEDGRQIKVRMTVSELHSMFMKYGGFIRVGRAYIINLRNIKNVSTSEVHLYNNIKILIPRGQHAEIKKAFWDFQYKA